MADHSEHERTGGLAGMGAGAVVGAAIGTGILPIVGTFAGGLLGGLLGSTVGKAVGGVLLDAIDPTTGNSTASSPSADLLQQLDRLSQLRAQGVLTEEEFIAAKTRLLRRS